MRGSSRENGQRRRKALRRTSNGAVEPKTTGLNLRFWLVALAAVVLAVMVRFAVTGSRSSPGEPPPVIGETTTGDEPTKSAAPIPYQARKPFDASAFTHILARMKPWHPQASLDDVREVFLHLGRDSIREL